MHLYHVKKVCDLNTRVMQRTCNYDERNKLLLLNLGTYGIQELVFCSIRSEN